MREVKMDTRVCLLTWAFLDLASWATLRWDTCEIRGRLDPRCCSREAPLSTTGYVLFKTGATAYIKLELIAQVTLRRKGHSEFKCQVRYVVTHEGFQDVSESFLQIRAGILVFEKIKPIHVLSLRTLG